jgi:hypothetical protein
MYEKHVVVNHVHESDSRSDIELLRTLNKDDGKEHPDRKRLSLRHMLREVSSPPS